MTVNPTGQQLGLIILFRWLSIQQDKNWYLLFFLDNCQSNRTAIGIFILFR